MKNGGKKQSKKIILLNLENRFFNSSIFYSNYTFLYFFRPDSDKMQNDEGRVVDLYIPRKCTASNRLIGAKVRFLLSKNELFLIFRTSPRSRSTSAMSTPSPALCSSRTPPLPSAALSAEWANLMTPSTDSPENKVLPSKFGISPSGPGKWTSKKTDPVILTRALIMCA